MAHDPSVVGPERSESSVDHKVETLERIAAQSFEPVLPTGAGGGEERPGENGPTVVLRLEELVADENGDILISVGDSLRTLVLETDARLLDRGTAPAPLGDADRGCGEVAYLSFEPGMTVYFPADLDVLVNPPGA